MEFSFTIDYHFSLLSLYRTYNTDTCITDDREKCGKIEKKTQLTKDKILRVNCNNFV